MKSFMENIPEQYQAALRDAIEAVTETRILLDQVVARFGTKEPEALRAKMGQTFEGITVTEAAVGELEALIALHEDKRALCQNLMDAAAKGLPMDGLMGEA